MKASTIFQRLYQRLEDMIPNFERTTQGQSFYAAPKVDGDMSLFCSVTNVGEGFIEVELAHDEIVDGEDLPAPWMVFRADLNLKQAEVLTVQDAWRYEVVYSEDNRANPRRQAMNIHAVNWLTIIRDIHSGFVSVTDTQSQAEKMLNNVVA